MDFTPRCDITTAGRNPELTNYNPFIDNILDGALSNKDEQVEELVIHATLKPAQKEFRDGYA